MNPDSSVGIATGYGLDGRGVEVRVPIGARFLSCPRHPDQLSTLPPSQWIRGGVALSSGIKGLRREADHSRPTSAEVKNN
jgi:hypothetical protein